jgi:hypothetical protein
MDHAQKRALQSTNGISGLGPRRLHLPPYTPALFLARRAATFVAYPAQMRLTFSNCLEARSHREDDETDRKIHENQLKVIYEQEDS